MLGTWVIGQSIEAVTGFLQQPLGRHPGQDHTGNADLVEISGAQQSPLTKQSKEALSVGMVAHGLRSMFHILVECKQMTNKWNIYFPHHGHTDTLLTTIPIPPFDPHPCVQIKESLFQAIQFGCFGVSCRIATGCWKCPTAKHNIYY